MVLPSLSMMRVEQQCPPFVQSSGPSQSTVPHGHDDVPHDPSCCALKFEKQQCAGRVQVALGVPCE